MEPAVALQQTVYDSVLMIHNASIQNHAYSSIAEISSLKSQSFILKSSNLKRFRSSIHKPFGSLLVKEKQEVTAANWPQKNAEEEVTWCSYCQKE